MNDAQARTLETFLSLMLKNKSNGGRSEVEIKKFETSMHLMGENRSPLFFATIEVGLVNDEGTMAEVLCRDCRMVLLGEKGSIRLMSTKLRSKKKTSGMFNALHCKAY